MACRRRNVRLAAIYHIVNNLVVNEDLNVDSFEKVQAWFKTNYPTIQTHEIITTLTIANPKEVSESKKAINERKRNVLTGARAMNKFGMFLNNLAQKHSVEPKENLASKQVNDSIKKFKELAKKDALTTEDYEVLQTMIESIPIDRNVDQQAIDSVINNLKGLAKQSAEQRDKARINRMTEKLDKLFAGKLERNTKKPLIPPSEEVKQFEKILKDLYSYAAQNKDINDINYGEMMQTLANIQSKYKEFYDEVNPDRAKAAIQQAVENYHQLRDQLKIDNINKRLSEINNNIERLEAWEQGSEVDITDLVTDNTSTPYRKTDKELLELEHTIDEAKDFINAKIEDIRRQQQVEKVLGTFLNDYKLARKTAKGMVKAYYKLKDFGWELPRTLNFMLDASFFGVQLMPVMAMELFSPVTQAIKDKSLIKTYQGSRKGLAKERMSIFQGYHRAATVFRDGFWMILKEEGIHLFNTAKSRDLKSANNLKTSKGAWARRMYRSIAEDDLFELMMKSGLKISRTKSLTDSEEYFKSSLINEVPIAGFIKDVSEDTMVTVLNMYRAMLFKQFYNNNPGLDIEEYSRAAESINNITGSTSKHGQVLGPAALAFSAPRLLYARLKHVAKFIPSSVALAVTTGKELSGKEVDVTNKFVRQNIVGGMTAILGIYALMAGIGAMVPGFIKVGSDWEDKDFMRVQIGTRAFDVTGGIGAILRFMANTYLYQFGPSEDASYSTKERLDYLRNVLKYDSKTAVSQFGFTKAHPTINGMFSLWSGEDFMGNPMKLPFRESTSAVETRAAALAKMFLPISVQTAGEDPTPGSVIPQFFGVNVIRYDDTSKSFVVTDWVNGMEYKPAIAYPTELKESKSKFDTESAEFKYLRMKYAKEWGKVFGDIILDNPDITKAQLKSKLSAAESKLKRDFKERYEDSLKDLPLAKEEKKK